VEDDIHWEVSMSGLNETGRNAEMHLTEGYSMGPSTRNIQNATRLCSGYSYSQNMVVEVS
jgi:hypothetical protein